jgi:hypothetical protein
MRSLWKRDPGRDYTDNTGCIKVKDLGAWHAGRRRAGERPGLRGVTVVRPAAWLASAILAVSLSRCGNGTATLSGKVTYRGRPVTSGSIVVLNADGTAKSGVIQPDGTYSVAGVGRGHVRLAVISPDPAHGRSVLTVEANRARAGQKRTHAVAYRPKTSSWFPLPRELGDPQSSGLERDVGGSSMEYDINAK